MADVGYIRVSTIEQNTDRQLDGINLDKVFIDKVSGKSLNRPQLKACLGYLRDGDTLHIHSMDRLARSLNDLENTVKELTSQNITVEFHKERLTFTNESDAMSTLLLQVMGAVAQFERALIRERQAEGIKAAMKRGVRFGRREKLSASQKKELLTMTAEGRTKKDVAAYFGISRPTLYKIQKNHTG